ncbi:MAG: cupin domain-containing protein [Haloarculaceae archaeon]|jgi:quercetin dioxygenase-like cupin family protein
MDYGVVHESELAGRRMSELYREYVEEDERKTERYIEPDERPPVDVRAGDVDGALGAEGLRVKLWRFEPGEEVEYHAHAEQEELYYVLEGEFSLKLGRSGEEEYVEVGPGTFWVAGPDVGHGHRCIGDETGVVLAVGAPPVRAPGLDPHELD